MRPLNKPLRFVGVVGCLTFASAAFAQYTMDLTTVGDGATAGGVYVSPYTGTVSQNGKQLYSGYVICDDFNTDSVLNTPWLATETSAGGLNGSEKFGGTQYKDPTTGKIATAQADYDAVAWLANQLIASPDVNNPNSPVQAQYSFAIWDIFDGRTDGGTASANLIKSAFAAVDSSTNPYVGYNVDVFTPSSQNPKGQNASQEFLVVNGPVQTPEPAAAIVIGFDLATLAAVLLFLRRRRIS